MKCGFFELDITPPLGSIIPGAFHARYANEIMDPLYVRSMVVRAGEFGLAVASVDACGITLDMTQRIRDRVCSMIPMQPEQIMVMATHCHGGGPTLNWGEQVVRGERYIDMLVEKTADSIVTAYQRAEDAEMLLGKEVLEGFSFIRVYRMKDGSLKTNPGRQNPNVLEPTTTVDPDVTVLAARVNGIYTGALINYANHPAIVADLRISGDYISELSAQLKKIYGSHFVSVFVNGACGNINHVDVFGGRRIGHREVGQALAVKVSDAITEAKPMVDETLCTKCKDIDVRFRKPTVEQLLAAKEVYDSCGDDLVNYDPETTAGYQKFFFALQALQIQADKRTIRKVHLQVFRIGCCYVFGTPCQIFVQFGKRMKQACNGAAFVSAFANDYCGYVPTPDCMVPGVYEATLAPTSGLEAAAGDKVVDAVIELYMLCSKI